MLAINLARMHSLSSQHWSSHLLRCWPFRRPQMRSEQYAFIWLQLPCDSGLGSAICVEIRRSRACQEQIQHGISIRSWTCRHSKACCQRCLPSRCIPRVITYDQPNTWPYMRAKHRLPSKVASFHSEHICIHLLSCVNWMDENAYTGLMTSSVELCMWLIRYRIVYVIDTF
jgi:hypothetical protein